MRNPGAAFAGTTNKGLEGAHWELDYTLFRAGNDHLERGSGKAMPKTSLLHPPAAVRDPIFISYSHRDRDWLKRLRVFLKPYTRQHLQIWADPAIRDYLPVFTADAEIDCVVATRDNVVVGGSRAGTIHILEIHAP